jgi:ATP-dependent helicase/nuclease subunit A
LPAMESDLLQISSWMMLLQNLDKTISFDEATQIFEACEAKLSTMKWETLGRKKKSDPEALEDYVSEVKGLREQYKKIVNQYIADYFFLPFSTLCENMEYMKPVMREMITLTKQFIGAFADKKRKEGVMDFSDLEHYALEILITKKEDGSDAPSEVAAEIRQDYHEIMIDEYQDSNYVQELILTSLAGDQGKAPYLFMVGDVKQSIYRFRLARPDLFLEKYHRYELYHANTVFQKGKNYRIDLNKNFRSREEVLYASNYVFENIMQKESGGIKYDDAVKLIPGMMFPESSFSPTNCVELMILTSDKENDDARITIKKKDKLHLEAAMIGQRIRQMVEGENPLFVFDGEMSYRKVEYRDIAILLRSMKGRSDIYLETLTDMGIPTYSDTKTGYFSANEIATMLNVLRIIDNPCQDIPLVSVLRSVLFQFTDEELAFLAALPRQLHYFDAMENYQNNPDTQKEYPELTNKLMDFMEWRQEYHEKSQRYSVYELLCELYQYHGYYQLMAAMPSGEKRAANLDMLLQRAMSYAEKGNQSIFSFVRYIEKLHHSHVDFGEALTQGEDADVVHITSIHKSKGLEFPVVFVADLGNSFSKNNLQSAILMDQDYGPASQYINTKAHVRRPTLMYQGYKEHGYYHDMAEEIRMLYVAMTRAKEKLIMTGWSDKISDTDLTPRDKKTENECANVCSSAEMKHDSAGFGDSAKAKNGDELLSEELCMSVPQAKCPKLSAYQILHAKNRLDWLIPLVLDEENQYISLTLKYDTDISGEEAQRKVDDITSHQALLQWDVHIDYEKEVESLLQKKESYQYPFAADQKLPVKVSVSELKHRHMDEIEKILSENVLDDELPVLPSGNMEQTAVLKSKMKIQKKIEETTSAKESLERQGESEQKTVSPGAIRGTLYHLIMEHLPYADWQALLARDEQIQEVSLKEKTDFIEKLFQQMVLDGYLSEEDCALVHKKDFVDFLASPLGQRMTKASSENRLKREQPFMLGVSAKEIYPEIDSEEMIMVQGIIDAYFFEENEVVLVDYKTDHIEKGEENLLLERYRAQLDSYAQALEKLTGCHVSQKILYSFSLGKELVLF